MADNLLESYNPLYDPYLRQYFALPHMQKHLRNLGLLDGTADKEQLHAGHLQMMDLMLRNRERVLQQLMDLQRKLDAAEKVELYRRIRSGITNADELNRSHLSRSLSRPARSAIRSGRETGEAGGARSTNRRQSLSPEAGELIKRVETDYRSDSAPFKNPKSIYNRLAANVYKYQYLHKLDDRTLRKYMNSLRKQLAKLERFREVSFGKETMAKHPPSQLQQSWFFRRRSLPSLDANITTAGANHHNHPPPPQSQSSQQTHHHQLPPPMHHANAAGSRSLKSGRKSRSGKSQSPLRVSALEEPPSKVQRTSVSRTRGTQRLPPLQQPMATSAKQRSLGVNRPTPVKSASMEQKLPPTAVIKPTRKMPPPEQSACRPLPVSAGTKVPAGKKTPPVAVARPLAQKGSITPVAVQKPVTAANAGGGGGILPAIAGAVATTMGTGEEENRESGAPSPSISLAASQTTTTDGGAPGGDSEWEGEAQQQQAPAPEAVKANYEQEEEEEVNGGTETRPTPEPFLEQKIETKLVGDLGMEEGDEQQLTARASLHSAAENQEQQPEEQEMMVQEPGIAEAEKQEEEGEKGKQGEERVEEEAEEEVMHAVEGHEEPEEPENAAFAHVDKEKEPHHAGQMNDDDHAREAIISSEFEEKEQPVEEEHFHQDMKIENPQISDHGGQESPPPEEPFEWKDEHDDKQQTAQSLMMETAEKMPEFEENQTVEQERKTPIVEIQEEEESDAQRFKREMSNDFEERPEGRGEEGNDDMGEHAMLEQNETAPEWSKQEEIENDVQQPMGEEQEERVQSSVVEEEPFEKATPLTEMDATESERIRRFSHPNVELETGPEESVRSLDGSVEAFEQSSKEEKAEQPHEQIENEQQFRSEPEHEEEIPQTPIEKEGEGEQQQNAENENADEVGNYEEGEEEEDKKDEMRGGHEEVHGEEKATEMAEDSAPAASEHESPTKHFLTAVEEPERQQEVEMAKSPVQIEITPSPENRNWDEEEEEQWSQNEQQQQQNEREEHVDAHQVPLTEDEEVLEAWEKRHAGESKDINGNFGEGNEFGDEEVQLLTEVPEGEQIVESSELAPPERDDDADQELGKELPDQHDVVEAEGNHHEEEEEEKKEEKATEEEKDNLIEQHGTTAFAHHGEMSEDEQQRPLLETEMYTSEEPEEREINDQMHFVHSEPVYSSQYEEMPILGAEMPTKRDAGEEEEEEWLQTQSDGERQHEQYEEEEKAEQHFERVQRDTEENEQTEKLEEHQEEASPIGMVDEEEQSEFVESESVQPGSEDVGRKLSGADAQLGLAHDDEQQQRENEGRFGEEITVPEASVIRENAVNEEVPPVAQQPLEEEHHQQREQQEEENTTETESFLSGNQKRDQEDGEEQDEQIVVESEPIVHDEMSDPLLNYYGKPHATAETTFPNDDKQQQQEEEEEVRQQQDGENTFNANDDADANVEQSPVVVIESSIVAHNDGEDQQIEAAFVQQQSHSPPLSVHTASRPATADAAQTTNGDDGSGALLITQPSIEITPASEYGGSVEDNREVPLTPTSHQAHPPTTVEEEEEQATSNIGDSAAVKGEQLQHENHDANHHHREDHHHQQGERLVDWGQQQITDEQMNSTSTQEQFSSGLGDDRKGDGEWVPIANTGHDDVGEFRHGNASEDIFQIEHQHQYLPQQNGQVPKENGDEDANSAKNNPAADGTWSYDDGENHQQEGISGNNGHLSPTKQNDAGRTSSPETEGADEEASDDEGSVIIHQQELKTNLSPADQQQQFQIGKLEADEQQPRMHEL